VPADRILTNLRGAEQVDVRVAFNIPSLCRSTTPVIMNLESGRELVSYWPGIANLLVQH